MTTTRDLITGAATEFSKWLEGELRLKRGKCLVIVPVGDEIFFTCHEMTRAEATRLIADVQHSMEAGNSNTRICVNGQTVAEFEGKPQ